MKKATLLLAALFLVFTLAAQERETIWPKKKMPNRQEHQIAAMTNETSAKGFKADNIN